MPQRNPTSWTSNTDKTDGVTYSSASVTYNSSTTAYSSSTVALDTFDKTPASWAKSSKIASNWEANPDAITNEYAYDSATDAYDSSTRSYDGIVSGEDNLNTSTPTVWADLVAS